VDVYSFVVEDFIIHDTRSLHSDTLHLNTSAFADGDLIANHFISMGDFDSGEYSTRDYVPSDQSKTNSFLKLDSTHPSITARYMPSAS
jgi:hypothetical protein